MVCVPGIPRSRGPTQGSDHCYQANARTDAAGVQHLLAIVCCWMIVQSLHKDYL